MPDAMGGAGRVEVMAKTKRRHKGPGRPQGDTAAETREALLAAGLRLFAQVGYEGASTRAILSEAGVTAPALYHHFDSKAGLFEAVAEQTNDLLANEFWSAAAEHETLVDKLVAIFERSADIQVKHPDVVQFFSIAPLEVRRHPEFRGAAREMNRLLAVLSTLCREHAPPGADVQAIENIAHVLLHGMGRLTATGSPQAYRTAVASIRPLLEGTLLAE